MSTLRRLHALLARLVLACFVCAIGVATASPLVQPRAMELVCAPGGAVKMVVQADDAGAAAAAHASHLDCPLCLPGTGAPPPAVLAAFSAPLPLGRALQPIEAARIAAATAAPPPARAPPALS